MIEFLSLTKRRWVPLVPRQRTEDSFQDSILGFQLWEKSSEEDGKEGFWVAEPFSLLHAPQ